MIMRTLTLLTGGILGLTLALGAGANAADPVAVVSARAQVRTVTPTQLADIFLGRSGRFPDGTPAVPCDLPEGSPLRTAFYERLTGKSSAQIKAYWSKLIFTGRGQPPREAPGSEEARRLVADNPGMVCYIDRAHVDRTVTVVLAP